MQLLEQRLGTDLQLLRNLEQQHDRDIGRDLNVAIRSQTGKTDLKTLSGVLSFQQALLLRFLTRVGELSILGHPNYGSRLHELIGEPNTETNRNRAKLFVLKSLADEPRVEEVLAITVSQNGSDPNRVDIDLTLKALSFDSPFNLVFPFFLFIVGTSIVFAYQGKQPSKPVYKKITIRTLKLLGLGLFLGAFTITFPFIKEWEAIRIPGVLQRIGVVFFFASEALEKQ